MHTSNSIYVLFPYVNYWPILSKSNNIFICSIMGKNEIFSLLQFMIEIIYGFIYDIELII